MHDNRLDAITMHVAELARWVARYMHEYIIIPKTVVYSPSHRTTCPRQGIHKFTNTSFKE